MSLDKKMIRDSFELAKPIANDVVDYFYKTMFEDYPEAKPLFKNADMEKQKQALLGALVFVVDNLDSPDKLKDYLQKMGARHNDYGVVFDHYSIVGNTLMKTFSHFFGPKWTKELAAEWIKAFRFIAGEMIEGQEKALQANSQMAKNMKSSAGQHKIQ